LISVMLLLLKLLQVMLLFCLIYFIVHVTCTYVQNIMKLSSI